MDAHDQEDWGALKKYLQAESLSPGLAGIALLLAAGLGALHALSPGHGKGMVAAYLIGSQGGIRDAVFLGGVMTFTHVISVLILGLVALFLSQYILPENLFPWLGVFSGVLVFLVGYWMLAQRALQALSHNHTHHHHHAGSEGPDHNVPFPPKGAVEQKDVSWRSLLSLGVAGGLVPCPTALVVLLAAVALNRISLGLLLILFFSLGLAGVLILIGILTVTASRLTSRFSESQAWVQKLPIFSAGIVMVVGISIAFNAVKAAGIISINI
jgi:ABC-type nickel/cobalt efflux system permease component RcnA